MKKDFPFALIAVLLVLGVCYGLAEIRPALPPSRSTPFSSTTGANATKPNEHVVMRINGEPITELEFNAFLQQAPDHMQAYFASPDGRRVLADQVVKLKALEQEGRRLGVEKDAVATSRIEIARANIVAGFALQKLVAVPSDERLRAEYEKEKKKFESIPLFHILVAYQGGNIPPRAGSPLSPSDAMKKAEAIEARLRAGGDFAQLARSQSDDVNSAAQGGRLGDVSATALPPEVQGAVANLKGQEISRPVRSAYGIHIFKSGTHTPRRFEEMKPMLAAKIQRDTAETMVSRLQKSARVELDPKFFPPQPAATPRGRS